MANKSKFLVVPYELLFSGGDFSSPNKRLSLQENIVEVKPPIGMVVTRVTIQAIADATPALGAVLISDHIPNNSSDGFLITGTTDPSGQVLPGQFTLENFGEESFSQSIYLANVSIGNAEIFVSVLFEGFINE
jgi:hypothetical protein